MTILFDNRVSVNPTTFATGINDFAPVKPWTHTTRPVNRNERAYLTGLRLSVELQCPVPTPERYSEQERIAFEQGVAEGARQVADWDAETIQMCEERELVRMHTEGYAPY